MHISEFFFFKIQTPCLHIPRKEEVCYAVQLLISNSPDRKTTSPALGGNEWGFGGARSALLMDSSPYGRKFKRRKYFLQRKNFSIWIFHRFILVWCLEIIFCCCCFPSVCWLVGDSFLALVSSPRQKILTIQEGLTGNPGISCMKHISLHLLLVTEPP